jgi:putative endonuclease
MIERNFYVYMLASRRNGTLYVGVTNDLVRRVAEHRSGSVAGFTRRYGVKTLVWFEAHTDVEAAIVQEKRIKGWNRAWKIALIEAGNMGWRDLAEDFGLGPIKAVVPAPAPSFATPRRRGPNLGMERLWQRLGPRLRGDDRAGSFQLSPPRHRGPSSRMERLWQRLGPRLRGDDSGLDISPVTPAKAGDQFGHGAPVAKSGSPPVRARRVGFNLN